MIDYWPVIMAGGAGTRFWPLSRRDRPKQFLAVVGDRSLLRQTWDRLAAHGDPARILVVTNADQAAGTREHLPDLSGENLVAEPEGRNTAACVGLAAHLAQVRSGADPVVGVFPADAWIDPAEGLARTVAAAVELAAAEPAIVTIGVPPTFPATGYGYVKQGARAGDTQPPAFDVDRFVEKPDLHTARDLLVEGGYLWNAGMFLFRASVVLDELARQAPRIHARLEIFRGRVDAADEAEALREAYAGMPTASFDVAVMEHARKVRVVRAEFAWDDVGSWAAVADHHAADAQGNVCLGPAVSVDASSNTVLADKLVALVGVQDLVVVQTRDAVLVCRRDRAEQVRELVRALEAQGRTELL